MTTICTRPFQHLYRARANQRQAVWLTAGALLGLLLAGCAAVPAPRAAQESLIAPATSAPPAAASSPAVRLSATAVAVSAMPSPEPKNDWNTLRQHPLRLPKMEPGRGCPATRVPAKQVSRDFGIALGDGPVYAIGVYDENGGTLYYGGAPAEAYGWRPVKTLWVSDRAYLGPILIRGSRLDGAEELRFDDPGTRELFLQRATRAEVDASSPSGWRNWPTYTYVRSPGCYAYQVDGIDFSYTIVVRAIDPPQPIPTTTAGAPLANIVVTGDAPGAPPGCAPPDVALRLVDLFDAINRGDTNVVPTFFGTKNREPFDWYSMTGTDAATGANEHFVTYSLDELSGYFARRHALRERVGLVSVRINGWEPERGLVHFGPVAITRSAADLGPMRGDVAPRAEGEGALHCATQTFAVLSFGMIGEP